MTNDVAACVCGGLDSDTRSFGVTVAGSVGAMSLTQRSSTRYMARPDATSLQGFYGRVDLDRQSGHLAGGPLSCDPVGYPSDISANTDSRHTRQVRTKCQLSGDDGRGTRWSENLNATLQIGGGRGSWDRKGAGASHPQRP